MKKINLRDIFPSYELNCYIEVPDNDVESFIAALSKETADVFIAFERKENSYRRRLYRYNAVFSLDSPGSIEALMVSGGLLPPDELERKITREEISTAFASLPEKQAKRVYAHYFLGRSKAAIARSEGVSRSQITRSIEKGLRNLRKLIENKC